MAAVADVSTVPRSWRAGRRGRTGRVCANVLSGVPSVAEARAVTVGLSVEVPSVDFGVLLVLYGAHRRTRDQSRRHTNHLGNIALLPGDRRRRWQRPRRGRECVTHRLGRIVLDGERASRPVFLRARGDDTVDPQFCGDPRSRLASSIRRSTVVLSPAATITGTVTFRTRRATPRLIGQVRVAAPLVDTIDFGPNPTTR